MNTSSRCFLLALTFIVAHFPNSSKAADPWDLAYAAKEQILLGNPKAAERLLKLVQTELASQDKEELDWELFKWTEEELKKTAQLSSTPPTLMPTSVDMTQVKASRPWYRSHWMWIGGAAAIGLWIQHEKKKSAAPQTTEGFQI